MPRRRRARRRASAAPACGARPVPARAARPSPQTRGAARSEPRRRRARAAERPPPPRRGVDRRRTTVRARAAATPRSRRAEPPTPRRRDARARRARARGWDAEAAPRLTPRSPPRGRRDRCPRPRKVGDVGAPGPRARARRRILRAPLAAAASTRRRRAWRRRAPRAASRASAACEAAALVRGDGGATRAPGRSTLGPPRLAPPPDHRARRGARAAPACGAPTGRRRFGLRPQGKPRIHGARARAARRASSGRTEAPRARRAACGGALLSPHTSEHLLGARGS